MASLPTYKCVVCGHTWYPRSPKKPRYCPNPSCHSANWETGLVRPPRAEQRANARQKLLAELERVFKVQISDETRKAAMERLGVTNKFADSEMPFGTVNAGPWRHLNEPVVQTVNLAEILGIQPERDMLVRVTDEEEDGQCLTGDDIYPGDLLVFRSGLQPEHNDIVLAIGHDLAGEFFATTKHWVAIGTDDGRPVVELRPSNPKCQTISAFQFNVEVQGVLVNAFRKPRAPRRPRAKRA